MKSSKKAKVTLVGAGPGAKDLITLKEQIIILRILFLL